MPGKHATGGDGVTLELPGFSVDMLQPPAGQRIPAGKEQLELRANVMMTCSCPIEPDGLWDANAFEVVALVLQRDCQIAEITLSYAGEIGQFAGTFPIPYHVLHLDYFHQTSFSLKAECAWSVPRTGSS